MRYDQAMTIKKPQSRRRRSFSKRRKNGSASVPTSDQWKSWKPMQFCAVEDSRNGDSERIIFRTGEDILVLNHDWLPHKHYNLCDSWVGKIVDIRGNSPRNTWVIVQWYFSGKDIAERENGEKARGGAGQDVSSYGKFERSLSQDRQVISTLSINGKAIVVEYDETSPLQEPIPSECFYTRRTYNSLFGSVMPAFDPSIACFCNRHYKPDDDEPMRFCPRFGCRHWCHENCLRAYGFISNKSPDECTQELLDIPEAQVGRIPPDLLRLACTPIIKGGSTYGVVGNVKVVCEAREWVQLYACTPPSECRPDLLLNGLTLDRWLDGLDGVEVEELIYPDDESLVGHKKVQSEVPYICSRCGKPI